MWFYLVNPMSWIILLGTLIATLRITPQIIRLARKIGVVDHGGYRRFLGRQTPLLGGLAIVLPMMVIFFLGILQPALLLDPSGGHYKDLALLATGGTIIALLGVVDDMRKIRVRNKFAFQFLVALLVCLSGKTLLVISLPVVGMLQLGMPGGMALTILWVVGLINAFNLVDGVDGLASGLALVSAVGLGIVAALNGQTTVVLVCLGLAGCLAGFLYYNFHPARIFLGDTGSMFLGFILATLALMGSSKTSGSVMLLTPMLILGFPIFDTVTTMIRRILRGRNPFVGDRAHTHHRLLDYGYSQRQVALIVYAVALLCTFSAVLCQVLYPQKKAPLIAVGICATVLMMVAWANGYLRLRHLLRVCQCWPRNYKLEGFIHFAVLSLKSDSSLANLHMILQVGGRELRLRFLEVGFATGDEDGDSILSIDMNGVAPAEGQELDAVETLQVHDAVGHALLIRYQLDHRTDPLGMMSEDARETDKLEHQDVMACLAHLFSMISIKEPPQKEVEVEPELAEHGGLAVIHQIDRCNGKH